LEKLAFASEDAATVGLIACATPIPLNLAVRYYPEIPGMPRRSRQRKPWHRPHSLLVFDTETRTDAVQSLLFGCFRFIVDGECVREALFHARDLSKSELVALRKYAASHSASVTQSGAPHLDLLTLDEFLNDLYRAAYEAKCLVVAFNMPFDLSRIGFDVAPARGKFAGGFSIGLWSYLDKAGRRKRNPFRPRVGIRHITSKQALIGLTSSKNPDGIDLDKERGIFRGHFLDLRTLAFALTNQSYSLESACDAFDVEHGKAAVSEHGKITNEYIDYCRRDVEATSELAEKLLLEFDRHPIQLPETSALSPASIGKAYLRTMGISPALDRQKSLQPFVGYAQSAFFGGRTSAHVRKVLVPVVYTDFLSMYPTVNSLMDLWKLVTAKQIGMRNHCDDEIRLLLERITLDDLFRQDTWKHLTAFVRVLPRGDILPSRCQYNRATNDWQVGVNHLYADAANDALWFALPDVIASTILTGKVPQIVDSFILEAHGRLPDLRPTKLRGAVDVDPRSEDFFKVVIEQRQRLSSRTDLSVVENERLDKALKVLANSTSYGIYAEMHRQEAGARKPVLCHGMDADPFMSQISNPEIPAEFCFPPFASLITAAARLMLAMLEKCVTDLGGTYAMEDTDSMAIIATEHGGPFKYLGDPRNKKTTSESLHALSWQQVEEIAKRFQSLNPYDKTAVPGSILKIEDDNRDPKTQEQRQLWCYAISAKRYALFLRDEVGMPELLRAGTNSGDDHWSQHGLGHLRNPTDLTSEDREWIAQVWQSILLSETGKRTAAPKFQETPAVGRITVSAPSILRALENLNSGKDYSHQIKPFNFLLSCHVMPFGHPVGTDPTRFHLIAPYETNPAKWTQLTWIDQYSGKLFRISTAKGYSSRQTAGVKTFGDVVSEYPFHGEPKCADAQGNVCANDTRGLLQRRHVRIELIRYIGKESNLLEEVDAGLIHSAADVYGEVVDQRRDAWERKIRPALKQISLLKLCDETGFSRRALINWRTGKSRPHPRNQRLLIESLRRMSDLHP
jgi:hypothetical protein